MSTLYDTDFAEWAYYNADLLRSGRVSGADLEDIAEEIESLARGQSHELKSRMIQIIERLQKLRLTSEELVERNGRGWRGSIARQGGEIQILLGDSPSLRRHPTEETLNECYSVRARAFEASFEITTPARCPFTLDEILG
jgi:hypothetical protein